MSKPDASRTRIEVLMPSQEWKEVQCGDEKKRNGVVRDNICRIELDRLMSENGMKAGDTTEVRVVHEKNNDGARSRKVSYATEVLELPDIAFVNGSDNEPWEEYESLIHADQEAESN